MHLRGGSKGGGRVPRSPSDSIRRRGAACGSMEACRPASSAVGSMPCHPRPRAPAPAPPPIRTTTAMSRSRLCMPVTALLVASSMLPAQEVRLSVEPETSSIRSCDDLLVSVRAQGEVASVRGFQLFLAFPAEQLEAVEVLPGAVSAVLDAAGPAPLGEGFEGCASADDPWDDGVGQDVIGLVGALSGPEGTDPPLSGDDSILARIRLRLLDSVEPGELTLSLAEGSCSEAIDATTRLLGADGRAVGTVSGDPVTVAVLDDGPRVSDLACEVEGTGVRLDWVLPAVEIEEVRILRSGELAASLAPDAVTFLDPGPLGGGRIPYDVVLVTEGGRESCLRASCEVEISILFRRGDVNADGSVNITDPVILFLYLFQAGTVGCADAADSNDDGSLNISDAVFLLNYLFRDGDVPPPPFEELGEDPEPADGLDCERFDPPPPAEE